MGKAIVDYIPVGRENAVTRRQLCELTGMRDRALRNAIEDARQNGEIIINAQDGRGYYRSEEPNDLAGQYVRNRNRAMAILVQQKYMLDFESKGVVKTHTDEFCFYIKDIAEYLQKSFNGQSDVSMSDVWALLDNHPIFPSDGFRSQIKNELKQNHGASVSRSTISFVDRS